MFKYGFHWPRRDHVTKAVAVLLCGAIFGSTFYIYGTVSTKQEDITAIAENNTKEYKWTKQVVEEGTTVNAAYLWPDETNPSFMAIYRDGELLSDEKMVSITAGSVYHFRGISEESVLYTEVYVGSVLSMDITSGEAGTWYRLLPSAIRTEFENSGWTWETGWEYTGRAYLDKENNRVMVKSSDQTAVLYGIGLYLDDKNNYSDDEAFTQEGTELINAFGNTENLFASALEHYYTRGGELRSTCPKIYAMVADVLSELDAETAQIRNDTATSEETEETAVNEPVLMTGLLDYVNAQRSQAELSTISWDADDDSNILIRVNEVAALFSQTRPDGTDAFSAYTDAVMCEMRIMDVDTVADIFDSAASYFYMSDLLSANCATYGNVTVLIFVW